MSLLDLYEKYVHEREGAGVIVNAHGFISFVGTKTQSGKEVTFIKDFFVEQEHRGTGIGKQLFEQVAAMAVALDHQAIICEVDFAAKNWRQSLQIIIGHGFRPTFCDGQMMRLAYDLTEVKNDG